MWKYLAVEHKADELTSQRARAQARRRMPRTRRSPLVITAGALGVAATAVAAVLLISGTADTPPAYALVQNSDGSIMVTINDLQTAIPQLNARFAAMGVVETVVPITASCPTQMSVLEYPHSAAHDKLEFTVDQGRKYSPPGFDGVLAAGYTSSGQLLVFIGAMKPPLPTCFPPHAATVSPRP